MTDDTLLILGRQPALGVAELESLYGSDKVRPVGNESALVQVMPCSVDFARLGGALKLCKILTALETTKWKDIEKFLVQVAPGHSKTMPEGKMHLGLSALGFSDKPDRLLALGLTIKKAINKQTGRTVRLAPNKSLELSTAQVLHNKLATENGWELVFVRDGEKTIIGQTLFIQDIASYALRDRGRPKRDARIGMLPPKLAQIIINLASGTDESLSIDVDQSSNVCLSNAENTELRERRAERTILDPFCGTGVLLQEAALMGYGIHGSDFDQRMVAYANTNVIEWLPSTFADALNSARAITQGDATNMKWKKTKRLLDAGKETDDTTMTPTTINFVASETYLGRPFTGKPSPEIVSKTTSEVNVILTKFLQNIHDQITVGTRLCLAVPAWQISPGTFRHLPLVDQIERLGYNRIRFEHVRDDKLLYYRKDQIVARELLVLIRK